MTHLRWSRILYQTALAVTVMATVLATAIASPAPANAASAPEVLDDLRDGPRQVPPEGDGDTPPSDGDTPPSDGDTPPSDGDARPSDDFPQPDDDRSGGDSSVPGDDRSGGDSSVPGDDDRGPSGDGEDGDAGQPDNGRFLGLFAGGQPGDERDDREGADRATGQPLQPDGGSAPDDPRAGGDSADADLPRDRAFGFFGLIGGSFGERGGDGADTDAPGAADADVLPLGTDVDVPGGFGQGGGSQFFGASALPALQDQLNAGNDSDGLQSVGDDAQLGGRRSLFGDAGGGIVTDEETFPLAGDTKTFPLAGDDDIDPAGGFFDLAAGGGISADPNSLGPAGDGIVTDGETFPLAGALGETGLGLLGLDAPDGGSSANDAESRLPGDVFGFLGAANTVGDDDADDPIGRVQVRFPWADSDDDEGADLQRLETPNAGDDGGDFFVPDIDDETLPAAGGFFGVGAAATGDDDSSTADGTAGDSEPTAPTVGDVFADLAGAGDGPSPTATPGADAGGDSGDEGDDGGENVNFLGSLLGGFFGGD